MNTAETNYRKFCERIWRDWLGDTVQVSEYVQRTFELTAAPEPYIWLKPGKDALVALFTNPGKVLPHQKRDSILERNSFLKSSWPYESVATALGEFYLKNVRNDAKRRNEALLELANAAGYDGVQYVECCPFHSGKFPKKRQFIEKLPMDRLLAGYVEQLGAFLRSKPVIVLSAVSTQRSLTHKLTLSPWLEWQAGLIGLHQSEARFVPLLRKSDKTTAAAFISRVHGKPKVLVLTMGGNRFPGKAGLDKLASAT